MALIIKRYKDLAGPYFHYNGSEKLYFSREAWRYFREENGVLVPISGVTSVCHVGPADPLMKWAVRMALERVLARMQDHRRPDNFYELVAEEFDDILLDAKGAAGEALDNAADLGHIAHAWIENFIRATMAGDEGRRMELLAKMPENEKAENCCIAFLDFCQKHNVRFLTTERRVYSRSYQYAGTCDATAIVDACGDPLCSEACTTGFKNQRCVLDHKTSNAIRTGYVLQVAAYEHADVEEHGGEYDAAWILRYGKEDAAFESLYIPATRVVKYFSGFECALGLSRTVENIEDWMGSIRDRRKEAAALAKAAALRVRCPKAETYKGTRLSKCFDDGTQCEACVKIFLTKHPSI